MNTSTIISIILAIIIIVLILVYVLIILPEINGMLAERDKLIKVSNILLKGCNSSLAKAIKENKALKNSGNPVNAGMLR